MSHSPGSVQDVPGIPAKVKEIFLTAWELDQMAVIDLAADRAPFIDQTQSMSLNIANPSTDLLVCAQLFAGEEPTLTDPQQLTLQLHAWNRGLKTGLYYLRTRAPAYPLPYGVGSLPSLPHKGKMREKTATAHEDNNGPPPCESCAA